MNPFISYHLYLIALHCTLQCRNALHSTVYHSNLMYYTLLHCNVPHCVQYQFFCDNSTTFNFSSCFKYKLIYNFSFWVQVLNRQQNRLALLEIPVSAFKLISSTSSKQEEKEFKIRLILEESSNIWINVSKLFYFLNIYYFHSIFVISFIFPSFFPYA